MASLLTRTNSIIYCGPSPPPKTPQSRRSRPGSSATTPSRTPRTCSTRSGWGPAARPFRLISLEEVENALVSYSKTQLRFKQLAEAEQANRRAVDLAHDRYRSGLVDFLDVLEAERSLYTAQAKLVQSERSASQNLVRLYKALGGGWKPEPTGRRRPITLTAKGANIMNDPSSQHGAFSWGKLQITDVEVAKRCYNTHSSAGTLVKTDAQGIGSMMQVPPPAAGASEL